MRLKIPPPALVILSILLMKALDWSFPLGRFQFQGQTLVAMLVVACGVILAVAALYVFRKAKTTTDPMHPEKASQIVTNGPYRFSRNPMYLSILLVLIGVVISIGNWLNILILVFFYAYITRFQIIPEEEVLRDKFESSFTEYCTKVRRWI
ncbi:MAG: isoprenylcysteine carboxylmethyltransferase family protein [Bacteroidota bacterium]